MKNKKKILAFLTLACTLVCTGFTGCKEDTAPVTSLYTFDGYDEISHVLTENVQGRLRPCSDEGYYTEGSGSLKLTVTKPTSYAWHRYGEAKDFLPPTLKFPIDETSLTSVSAFTVDVYNANAYDTGVYLYVKSADKIAYSGYAVANANRWSKLSFAVNACFAKGSVTDVYISIADTNENTTYYFDALQTVGGTSAQPRVSSDGTTVLALDNAEELRALGFYTKTDVPAAHLRLASDPQSGTDTVVAVLTEKYTGRINPISWVSDDREYGFTVWETAVKNYDFSEARKCYIEVYNATEGAKKITLFVGDGTNTATTEKEIPVGEWTKLSVNNLLSLDLTKISQLGVSMNSYDGFEAGTVYFKNLSVEVKA
ncbi:MAG: hypothetical protein IJ514_00220 [Clostridia bacterium]|nr:hypothetical protein [Clostridia bacterium]